MPEAVASGLRRFLARELGPPDPADAPELVQLGGGRSNLTFALVHGGRALVLRHPPAGVAAKAGHDVGREFRVLSALSGTPVPVPKPLLHCQDPSVLGAPFYVMERVPGRVLGAAGDAPDLTGDRLRRLGAAAVDGMAAVHALDPAAIGLGDLGRPDGYVERQVRRWTGQWEAERTRDIPELDEIARRLRRAFDAVAAVPSRTHLIHGDFNIGNLLVAPAGEFDRPPVLRAVLDWEMSTLGHPLMDLALLAAYNGPLGRLIVEEEELVSDRPGFPSTGELVETYGRASATDTADFDFFYVLAFFKMVVITEALRARYRSGATAEAALARLGDSAPILAAGILDHADRSSIPALRAR